MTNRIASATKSLLLLSILPLAATTSAYAEEGIDGKVMLDEIIVTATRRAENLQDVPISVNAFTSDKIEKMRIQSYEDLALAVPGFAINAFSKSRFTPILRGGASSLFSAGSESAVALYIDDIYFGGAGDFEIDLFDVERIEVLRGPQGTLFGRNSTGGSINVVTKNPTEETSGKFEVSYGNYDYLQLRGMINAKLADNLYALVAATSTNRGGTSFNRTTGNNIENMNKASIRAKLLWDAGEDIRVIGSFGVTMRDETGVARDAIFLDVPITQSLLGDFVPDSDPRVTSQFSDGRYEQNQITAGLRIEKDFDKGQLLSITSFRNMETKDALTSLAGAPVPIFAIGEPRDVTTLSQEFRYISDFEGPFNFVGGLYGYYSDDNRTVNAVTNWDASTVGGAFQAITFCPTQTGADFDNFTITPSCLGSDLITLGNQTVTLDSLYTPNSFSVFENVITKSYSIFGEGTYDITDTVRVLAGFRWTSDKKELKSGGSDGDPDFFWNPQPGLRVSGKDGWDQLTYRFGLSWNVTEDVMVFATRSKGFRSGAYDVAQSDVSLSNVAVAPETVFSNEIGIKSKFLDGRVMLNVTGFDVTYNNLQFFVNTGSASITTNAGEASVQGIEVEFLAALTNELQLSLNYSHQNGDSTGIPVEAEIAEGTPPQGTVPNTYIARLSYETELDNGGVFFAAVDFTKKSRYGLEFNDTPQFSSEVKGMVNLRASYKFPDSQWKLAAWGKNITNENVVIYGQDFWFAFYNNAAFVANPDITSKTSQPRYGDPATYGMTLSYSF